MNPLRGSGVSERSRCGAVRILELAGEPSAGIGRVGSLAGEPSAGIGVVPCASLPWPMNPLQGSGVSERSRCGAVRILAVAHKPSTGIGRVGSLAGEPSAGIGVVPCASLPWPMNPLQGSGVSERSRCGAVRILAVADEPSTGIGRVGSLADEPSAGIGVVPCPSCRGPMNPLQGSLAVVPCASLPWPMNPLQGSGVSERSRCGAVPILELAGEPSARIGRVGSLSLWCRAHP